MSDQRPPVLRRVARVTAVLLVSLLVAVILAEIAIRATDPYGISYYKDVNRYINEAIEIIPEAAHSEGRIFQNRPGVELELQTFSLVTNQLGFRSSSVDDGLTAEPIEGKKRILFIGDSVTFGWGVDDEDSWVRTVERDGVGPTGEPLTCINAGHLIYNSLQEADLLATVAPVLRPDAVVLTYVVNDIDDSWAMYQEIEAALAEVGAEGPKGPVDRLRGKLPVWFRGIHGLMHFRATRQDAQELGDLQLERVEDAPGYVEGWARSLRGLERMRTVCAEQELAFVVFDHTVPRIPDLKKWCEAREVAYYDLTFTDAEWDEGLTNSVADFHANERGNRLIADKALMALRSLGILGS